MKPHVDTQAMDGCTLLRQAKLWVQGAILISLVVLGGIVVDGLLRANRQDQGAAVWMQQLDLSSPAFWPAGTVQRYPNALPAGMDLRLCPFNGFGAVRQSGAGDASRFSEPRP
ncbi:MAG: hypothetical protein VR64_13275 [Desulfatitalea sp. BRH_c12]|nr:MAG: hypothetical protein VR64_13275 [Desulfatitalea sp. BRH_c12]